MLAFDNLKKLQKHITYLQKSLHQEDVFLVGGSVRDVLLGLVKSPIDIDLTMAGDPATIFQTIDKTKVSCFMTEKYGTITIIPDKTQELQYEITPFRTEGGYDDLRHPGEIHRSNDLLLDSNRRDFTINCLYYTSTKAKAVLPVIEGENKDMDKLSDILKKNGIAYIGSCGVWILQDPKIIEKLFAEGHFQAKYFDKLIKTLSSDMIIGAISPVRQYQFVIDPHHGIQDILDRKLQTVGHADKRFTEDALRILRALRFVSVLNHRLKQQKHTSPIKLFDFVKSTRQSLKKHHHLLDMVAKERIKDELMKIFDAGDAFAGISLMDEAGLLPMLFPALAATKNINQPLRFHPFDVYTHTLLCLYHLQQAGADALTKFAMLYHDVGKVDQYGAYKDDLSKEEIREILAGPLNHRRSSPEIAQKDFQRLCFSTKEIDEITRLIAHHHTPEELLDGEDPEKIKKKLRKFLSEAGLERADKIIQITIADRLGQYNPLQNSSDLTEVHELQRIIHQLHAEEGQFTIKQMDLSGNDIMAYFKLQPGKHIGELLQKAFDWVLSDISGRNTKEKILDYLKEFVK